MKKRRDRGKKQGRKEGRKEGRYLRSKRGRYVGRLVGSKKEGEVKKQRRNDGSRQQSA